MNKLYESAPGIHVVFYLSFIKTQGKDIFTFLAYVLVEYANYKANKTLGTRNILNSLKKCVLLSQNYLRLISES